MQTRIADFTSRRRFVVTLVMTLVVIFTFVFWMISRRHAESTNEFDDVTMIPRDEFDLFSIPEDATDVMIFASPYMDSISVTYLVSDKFPAVDTIQRISTDFETRGWKLLDPFEGDPDSQSSEFSGWTNDRMTTKVYGKSEYQREWDTKWVNEKGEEVLCRLSYPTSSSNITVSESLFVDIVWYSLEAVEYVKATDAEFNRMRESGALDALILEQ
jgi:hypothetical protein